MTAEPCSTRNDGATRWRLPEALSPSPDQGIHKSFNILLPETETLAMIFTDDELDHRIALGFCEFLGRIERRERFRHLAHNQRGELNGRGIFLIFFPVTL
jgi:hypothetical protein